MALSPGKKLADTSAYRLQAFDAVNSDSVASWVRSGLEAFWLAPKTKPPITGRAVASWARPGHEPLELVRVGDGGLVAYGELNALRSVEAQYWLGHLIVDPARRGHGLGLELTQRLLRRAFSHLAAVKVSLVVFPENEPAIACYRAAGMVDDGYEVHEARPYGRHIRLLRMAVARRD